VPLGGTSNAYSFFNMSIFFVACYRYLDSCARVQECNDSSTALSLSVLKAASPHLPSGLAFLGTWVSDTL
jgi:hypothetical protein